MGGRGVLPAVVLPSIFMPGGLTADAATQPLRLTADGGDLFLPDGNKIILAGVNFYLEWYRTYHEHAFYDVKNLRRHIPAANVVRFVASRRYAQHKTENGSGSHKYTLLRLLSCHSLWLHQC